MKSTECSNLTNPQNGDQEDIVSVLIDLGATYPKSSSDYNLLCDLGQVSFPRGFHFLSMIFPDEWMIKDVNEMITF